MGISVASAGRPGPGHVQADLARATAEGYRAHFELGVLPVASLRQSKISAPSRIEVHM
jgi:hypothetical protein